MKTGLIICGPDVAYGPLALLTGTFEEKVSKASELGCDGIELMVRDPSGLDWPSVKLTLDRSGLEVSQIVTGELFGADGLCLVTPDKDLFLRAEERTRAVIDLGAYLGSMVNIGRLRGRLDSVGGGSKAWSLAVERIGNVAAYADSKGVKIALEPINRYEIDFILTCEEGLRLIRDIKCDNVGLMLDLFHMNIEEPSIEDGLRLAEDKLWHVHIADSNRHYPGSGHLDFESIFGTLRDLEYKGYLSAEIMPLPDPDVAAKKTFEFLRYHDLI